MRKRLLSVTAALVLTLTTVLSGFLVEAAPVVIPEVDQARLAEVLYEGLISCEETISVSEFNIPYDPAMGANDAGAVLLNEIVFSFDDVFYIESFQMSARGSGSGYIISSIMPTYTDTSENCVAKRTAAIQAANEMIADLGELTDLQVALVLHDRLAQTVEYDMESAANNAPVGSDCYTMYGALVNHLAVCEGYTAAYAYMLDQFDIANRKCRSVALNHVWNIITIGGTEYHVDVTHDDPMVNGLDRLGLVWHKNFLRSSAGIYSTTHAANDYDATPDDTTYDSYFWQDIDSAFQYLDGSFYYIDNHAAQLRRWTGGESSETMLALPDRWNAGAGYYSGCYAKLAADGKTLIYHDDATIYRYHTADGETTVLCTPELEDDSAIYGLRVRGRELDYAVDTNPYGAGPIVKTYILRRIADGNGDGDVTDADRMLLSRYLADWDVEIDLSLMDINGDGAVTAIDRAILARYLAQWGEPYNSYFD
ncbi:MAG: hypothetical protein J6X30_04560 [Clostridia bacterium]|nr:hypothetical protein [Clostridia bacterium]